MSNNKNILSKKAYTYIALFFAIILIVSMFAGCGTDTITGGNGNPPPPVSNDSLVASFDSLSLYFNGLNAKDTSLYNVFNVGDSIKVVLTTETNCSGNDTALVGIIVGNISVNLINVSNTFTFYGLRHLSSSGVAFILYLKTTSLRYVKIKNVKLYKVNPV